jgi:hypothetical protein
MDGYNCSICHLPRRHALSLTCKFLLLTDLKFDIQLFRHHINFFSENLCYEIKMFSFQFIIPETNLHISLFPKFSSNRHPPIHTNGLTVDL